MYTKLADKTIGISFIVLLSINLIIITRDIIIDIYKCKYPKTNI